MTKSGIHRSNAGDLKPLARTFLETYEAAAAKTDEDFRRVISSNTGYQHFEGGLVELTDQVTDATDALVAKAVQMIGPKGSSERALTAFAEEVGKDLVRGDLDLDSAVTRLIEKFSRESNASYELILPNYLIDFQEGVRSVDMGPVRAAIYLSDFFHMFGESKTDAKSIKVDLGFDGPKLQEGHLYFLSPVLSY